jgi:hypothetical protein
MSERTDNFKAELAALCRKYHCDITAEDHYQGYPECGEGIRMTVNFDGDYTVDPVLPDEELDLGRYFDGKGKP